MPMTDLKGENSQRVHRLFFFKILLSNKSLFLLLISFFAQNPNLFNHHTLVSYAKKKKKEIAFLIELLMTHSLTPITGCRNSINVWMPFGQSDTRFFYFYPWQNV